MLIVCIQEIKPADLDFLEHLASYSCVVPLIAKADTLGLEELKDLKSSVIEQLSKSGIVLFPFNLNDPAQSPYAVCSAPSNDLDASILVSDYVQPLLPSELGILIDRLFDQDNIAHMRHASARKLLDSCKVDFLANSLAGSSPAIPRSSFPTNQAITSRRTQLATHTARLEDLTKKEERMAQIRLAKWADDMRKRMRDERAQFEELYQTERAAWLSQRLGECTGGTTSPRSTSPTEKGITLPEYAGKSTCTGVTNFADPLGLVRWNEAMRRRGWIAFQIAGSFGVIGAVAVWAARTWGASLDGSSWSLGRWVRA